MSTKLVQESLDKFNLKGWKYHEENKHLQKGYEFKSYLKTISFVNALAWVANKENHHPDLEVYFNRCIVKIKTHDLNSVTDKDFQLAGMIDQL